MQLDEPLGVLLLALQEAAPLAHVAHRTDPVLGSQLFAAPLFLESLQPLQVVRLQEGHAFERARHPRVDAVASVRHCTGLCAVMVFFPDWLGQSRIRRHLLEQVVHASDFAALGLAPQPVAWLRLLLLQPILKLDVLGGGLERASHSFCLLHFKWLFLTFLNLYRIKNFIHSA